HGHVSGLLLLPLFNKSKFVFTAHNPNPWMVQSFSHFKQSFRQTSFSSIELRIIRKADRVITVGEHLRNELVNRFKIQPEKVEVVYNGVDVDIFRPNLPDPENVLAKYELPPEYVLFVGRLVEQKGVQYLLEAVKGTNIHIVIVGGGPLLSYLRNLCKRLQITQQVHFIGAVPLCDLRKIYSRAQLFVLPSVAEGFPGGLVGLEAMASGLPLIASKIVGIEQLVTDGYNGSLFEIGDTHKLRSKLVQIFNDKALIKKMGKHSRKIAEKHFSWSAVAKRTLQLYQSLIANN
ncbi:MAG: glycosyltransferase family 4 protein, partial [Promethearchaeota archaeon]